MPLNNQTKLKPFHYVETIAIHECRQISSNSFKKEITYNCLIKQMADVKLWLFF